MNFSFEEIGKIGRELNQKVLQIAMKVSRNDSEAITMYAEDIANEFCQASVKDFLKIASEHCLVNQKGEPLNPQQIEQEASIKAKLFQKYSKAIEEKIYRCLDYLGK